MATLQFAVVWYLIMTFQVGDHVECYYDDGWYPGVIQKVNSDGSYFIKFDDGDQLEVN